MCLSINSLSTRFGALDGMTPEHHQRAEEIYRFIWPHLDHTRRYCINRTVVAKELINFDQGHTYDTWKFKSIEKQKRYDDFINHILTTYVNLLSSGVHHQQAIFLSKL